MEDCNIIASHSINVEDERILQQGFLSKNSTYKIIVKGAIGVRELERLIRKLEFEKEILCESQCTDITKPEFVQTGTPLISL